MNGIPGTFSQSDRLPFVIRDTVSSPIAYQTTSLTSFLTRLFGMWHPLNVCSIRSLTTRHPWHGCEYDRPLRGAWVTFSDSIRLSNDVTDTFSEYYPFVNGIPGSSLTTRHPWHGVESSRSPIDICDVLLNPIAHQTTSLTCFLNSIVW